MRVGRGLTIAIAPGSMAGPGSGVSREKRQFLRAETCRNSHPKVKAWLAGRARWHMHFVPTYSSWLNQVERFFALTTDKAIRRGSFTSVKQLVSRIDQFVTHHNTHCRPFRWTATADSILEKLHRLCSRISGTAH